MKLWIRRKVKKNTTKRTRSRRKIKNNTSKRARSYTRKRKKKNLELKVELPQLELEKDLGSNPTQGI